MTALELCKSATYVALMLVKGPLIFILPLLLEWCRRLSVLGLFVCAIIPDQ